MPINTNESLAGDMINGDSFVKLDLSARHIDFGAAGEISDELDIKLESAEAALYKPPCPTFVSVDDVPGLGNIQLLHSSDGLYVFAVGGFRGELTRKRGEQRGDDWQLKIQAGGPHNLDESQLAGILANACELNKFIFGTDAEIKVESCSVALCCHLDPDVSDTKSRGSALMDFIDGRIPQVQMWPTPALLPDSDSEVAGFVFGDPTDGRRVRLSGWHQEFPWQELGLPAESTRDYQEGREVAYIELSFYPPFIDLMAEGIGAVGDDLNLSRLLLELVRAALGDETLPHSFFRVATLESASLPDYLRPNSAAWVRVRRAFLEGVAESK